MEDRTRLGRGLEEISQLYLSDRPRDPALRERRHEKTALRRTIIRILYPTSPALKSCLAANFALELAKGRHPVTIRDGFEGKGVYDMLRQMADLDLNPGAATVRLYGLPDIVVYPFDAQQERLPEGGAAEMHPVEKGGCMLLNLSDTLESVVQGEVFFDAVLMTGVDEASLLQCYAFIKVIWEREASIRVHIVVDNPGTEACGHEIFSRLSGFVKAKLSGDLNLLGFLMHDDLLEKSMSEHKPLVLSHEHSAARESIIAVARAFQQTMQMKSAR